jgi:hypothetical protein
VLVRRGRFRRRVAGSAVDLDPTVAYLGAPGEVESFAHPAGGDRVRVGRVVDRIDAGEQSLARLAADLDFADQAHLCRTVRAHVGHTPTALRLLLAGT